MLQGEFMLLTHQVPVYRWSLVSLMVSVRPFVCLPGKQKQATYNDKNKTNATWGLVGH